ncbi:hypothetical protein [Anaerobiospirillum sp. NML120449]|uniref:hypothetical protein n=1 Tax=Anaerobiospirillum sp. NML120449 TaxID=2932817 RepID=UPI001FF206B8|nr:hypothetical protein [Anaerobiospirillum sp. NML120449]MCK0525778.1 hypothetical protein [Anaerobiospirillum sp. NML120449]
MEYADNHNNGHDWMKAASPEGCPADVAMAVTLLAFCTGYTDAASVSAMARANHDTFARIFPDYPLKDLSEDIIRRALIFIGRENSPRLLEKFLLPVIGNALTRCPEDDTTTIIAPAAHSEDLQPFPALPMRAGGALGHIMVPGSAHGRASINSAYIAAAQAAADAGTASLSVPGIQSGTAMAASLPVAGLPAVASLSPDAGTVPSGAAACAAVGAQPNVSEPAAATAYAQGTAASSQPESAAVAEAAASVDGRAGCEHGATLSHFHTQDHADAQVHTHTYANGNAHAAASGSGLKTASGLWDQHEDSIQIQSYGPLILNTEQRDSNNHSVNSPEFATPSPSGFDLYHDQLDNWDKGASCPVGSYTGSQASDLCSSGAGDIKVHARSWGLADRQGSTLEELSALPATDQTPASSPAQAPLSSPAPASAADHNAAGSAYGHGATLTAYVAPAEAGNTAATAAAEAIADAADKTGAAMAAVTTSCATDNTAAAATAKGVSAAADITGAAVAARATAAQDAKGASGAASANGASVSVRAQAAYAASAAKADAASDALGGRADAASDVTPESEVASKAYNTGSYTSVPASASASVSDDSSVAKAATNGAVATAHAAAAAQNEAAAAQSAAAAVEAAASSSARCRTGSSSSSYVESGDESSSDDEYVDGRDRAFKPVLRNIITVSEDRTSKGRERHNSSSVYLPAGKGRMTLEELSISGAAALNQLSGRSRSSNAYSSSFDSSQSGSSQWLNSSLSERLNTGSSSDKSMFPAVRSAYTGSNGYRVSAAAAMSVLAALPGRKGSWNGVTGTTAANTALSPNKNSPQTITRTESSAAAPDSPSAAAATAVTIAAKADACASDTRSTTVEHGDARAMAAQSVEQPAHSQAAAMGAPSMEQRQHLDTTATATSNVEKREHQDATAAAAQPMDQRKHQDATAAAAHAVELHEHQDGTAAAAHAMELHEHQEGIATAAHAVKLHEHQEGIATAASSVELHEYSDATGTAASYVEQRKSQDAAAMAAPSRQQHQQKESSAMDALATEAHQHETASAGYDAYADSASCAGLSSGSCSVSGASSSSGPDTGSGIDLRSQSCMGSDIDALTDAKLGYDSSSATGSQGSVCQDAAATAASDAASNASGKGSPAHCAVEAMSLFEPEPGADPEAAFKAVSTAAATVKAAGTAKAAAAETSAAPSAQSAPATVTASGCAGIASNAGLEPLSGEEALLKGPCEPDLQSRGRSAAEVTAASDYRHEQASQLVDLAACDSVAQAAACARGQQAHCSGKLLADGGVAAQGADETGLQDSDLSDRVSDSKAVSVCDSGDNCTVLTEVSGYLSAAISPLSEANHGTLMGSTAISLTAAVTSDPSSCAQDQVSTAAQTAGRSNQAQVAGDGTGSARGSVPASGAAAANALADAAASVADSAAQVASAGGAGSAGHAAGAAGIAPAVDAGGAAGSAPVTAADAVAARSGQLSGTTDSALVSHQVSETFRQHYLRRVIKTLSEADEEYGAAWAELCAAVGVPAPAMGAAATAAATAAAHAAAEAAAHAAMQAAATAAMKAAAAVAESQLQTMGGTATRGAGGHGTAQIPDAANQFSETFRQRYLRQTIKTLAAADEEYSAAWDELCESTAGLHRTGLAPAAAAAAAAACTGRITAERSGFKSPWHELAFYEGSRGLAMGYCLDGLECSDRNGATDLVLSFDLRGCVVSAAGMANPRIFVESVLFNHADYFVALKSSQKAACQTVREVCERTWGIPDFQYTFIDPVSAHRTVRLFTLVPGSAFAEDFLKKWPGLAPGSALMVRTLSGPVNSDGELVEERFFLSSLTFDGSDRNELLSEVISNHYDGPRSRSWLMDINFYHYGSRSFNADYLIGTTLLEKTAEKIMNHAVSHGGHVARTGSSSAGGHTGSRASGSRSTGRGTASRAGAASRTAVKASFNHLNTALSSIYQYLSR